MSVAQSEVWDRPGGISREEWSILARVLPDRWPDGRPRSPWPQVAGVLHVSAAISILATMAFFALAQFPTALPVLATILAMTVVTAALAPYFLMAASEVRMLTIGRREIGRFRGSVSILHGQAAELL